MNRVSVAVALLAVARSSPAQGTFAPGAREIIALSFSSTAVGEFPAGLQLLSGLLEVVEKDGLRMLRASSPSEFLLTLPEVLPEDFTLEFDLVPKLGSNPQDLSFEGTPRINQGTGSAHVLWHATGLLSVIGGGGENYETSMPEELQGSLPGVLTHVTAEFQGTTLKLYTNGRRLYTLNKQFARGQVLRVFLGGQNDREQAVYLARLRVAAGGGSTLATNQQASVGTMRDPAGGGAIGPVGGAKTPATVAPTAPPPSAGVPSSGGATTQGPVVTAQSTTRAPPPPPPPAAIQPMPPIGAAPAPPSPAPPLAGTPGWMRLDNVPFNVELLQGGSTAASVIVVRMPDGGIEKHLSSLSVEPLVFNVSPGSPVDGWLKSMLSGAAARKDGSLFGGVVVDQQQLDFQRALLTSVTFPTLDAGSSAPGFLRVSISPEATLQAALSGPTSATPQVWTLSDFRFTMDNLETRGVTRIESFTIGAQVQSSTTGAQRIATTTSSGMPEISNLLVTISADALSPATNWLAWYDDFVVKGNNGADKEKSFTLELGIGASGAQRAYQAKLTLKAYGVGIVALRALPQPAGSTTRRLQAELYVERMELSP